MTPRLNIKREQTQVVKQCLQKLESQRKYRPLQKVEYKAIHSLRFECESAE